MKYDCSSSGTETSKVRNVLINNFGYSSAYSGDYNYNVVVSELSQDKPVILSGGEKEYWEGIIPYYGERHAWVCDGYMKGYNCFYDDSGNVNGGYGYLLFHMNWGWDGQYDGFFGLNNFSVNGNSFNYKNKMIYGIRK